MRPVVTRVAGPCVLLGAPRPGCRDGGREYDDGVRRGTDAGRWARVAPERDP